MSSKRYTVELKIEAVKQVTDRGHSAPDVAKRLGAFQLTLYELIKRYGVPEAERLETQSQSAEIRKRKAELRQVTEERDILKKAAASQRLPRLASRTCYASSEGRSTPLRPDQAILVGERWCPWVPQDYR